uniref:F-box domain-containing protein n=1 Tax=Oryza glumipatula TaxID=40148 RepID=A0A0E0BGD7_9ORYZ
MQSPPPLAKRRRCDARDEDAPAAASDADRLSALPDDILHTLLSLLPAHEAVRTCALGRRWRDVWRSAPAVRVTGAGGWDSAAKFTAFLDGLLRRLRSRRRPGDASPRLESFVFDLNEIDFGFAGLLPSKSNHLHLSRAIWRAARHEVRVLRFRLFTSEQRLRLPDLPLVSHHLPTLELAHVRVNDRVLDFSSCPSLLDLILHRCYIDAVQMSSQSLNRLIMTDCAFLVDARTRMSLPGLIALKITLLSGRAPFLESMPLLETAIVSLHCDCGDKWGWTGYIRSDNDKSVSRLLQGLSEATNLCLLAHRRVCILNADLKWCPTFSKLKNLVLNDWCVTSNLHALIYFLQHSPILERLTLHLSKVRTYSLQTTERYKPREQSFAFDHLKKVEFMCDEVDDRVRKISKILSTYVTPLQVNVRIRCFSYKQRFLHHAAAGGSSTAINRRRRALDLRPLVGDRGEDRVVFSLSLSTSPRDQRYTLIIDSFSSSPLSRSVNFLARFLSSFDARKVFDGMSPESKKTLVEGGGDDRISFLPTALLQHVLSFLQAKEVVRTCVLARRWRLLWKSMPILRVTGAGDARAFHTFTYHLLLLRDRSPLESCTFDFNVFSKDDMPIVNLWIRYVLLCQVRVLTLAIGGHELTDLPVVSPILTRLELSRLSVNGKFLDFSSCPALKELKMTNCEISADKISSKSLKRLRICECKFKSKMRTRISVPSLLFLKLIAVKGRTPFLEDMPVLVAAKVLLLDFYCKDCCDGNDPGYCPAGCCVLLKGLADATNLELIADPEVFILKRDLRWCPTFTNLKTLLLSQWFESSDHCALICILQHSPVLEKLTLQLSKKSVINVRSRAIYNSMEKPFTSENLKTVEVKCQDIDQRVHKLMKSLNSYGIPLERINIQQTNQFSECFNFVWTGFIPRQLRKTRAVDVSKFSLICHLVLLLQTNGDILKSVPTEGMKHRFLHRVRRRPPARGSPTALNRRVSPISFTASASVCVRCVCVGEIAEVSSRRVFDGMSPESKKAAVEGGGGGDHIGALPDALLQHVLSFLQSKEVVRTCVLARRWRHLWQSVPVLRVTGADEAIHKFMDHLLLLRDRSPLETCVFAFCLYSKHDAPFANLWIRYVILSCQVRVLTLDIIGLRLIDLPVVSGFLTTLELGGMSVHGKFLDFSSCPALEELKMTKCTISADKISSQSLKRLSICECKFKSDGRTVISVPSLLFLQLIAFKGRTPFLEDMTLLVTAKVILSGYHCTDYCYSSDPGYCPIGCTHCYGIDDGSAGCVLLKGLADASNLELIADPKVWFESAENCALICILQHSPFLEKLTLQLSKKPDINMRSRAIYNSMGKSFASDNLKTVEVKCQDIDKKVHKLIMSLNSYGIPLEKINIQQTNESYEWRPIYRAKSSTPASSHQPATPARVGRRPPAAASGKEAAPFANPSAPASNPRSTGCSEESISDALFLHVLYSPHRVLSRFGARHLFDVMPHPRPRGGDDRLGALPDEALQHVLSFLPLPEAVRTGALARRWRHLWKSMPVLRITGEGRVLNRRGVRRLNRFVNHLLLLRDRSARLDACEINLGTFLSQDDPQINLWIRHVLLCEAQDLWVHLSIDNNSFEMENLALVSRHLTRLELSNVVLKDHFLNFSSCPALEELVTRNCHIEAEEILSESLKWLTAVDCVFSSYPRTRISLPSLVALELTEPWGSTPVLESMPSLLTASIKLTDCDDHCGKEEFGGSCDDNVCDNCGANGGSSGDCVLLDGLSEAESLELIAKPRVFIFRRDLMWCPTFSKLKTLLLNEWSVAIDLVALICFLQHTPVLEKLTLQLVEAPVNWMENEGSYDPTENPFASKQLKVVEVKCEKFDLRVHKIIMIFSTYGVNIEQIYIQRSVIHSEEPTDDSGAGPSRLRTPPISTSENAQLKSTIDQMSYWHNNSNSTISYPSCSGGSRSSVISQPSFRNILLLPFLRGLHKLIFILQDVKNILLRPYHRVGNVTWHPTRGVPPGGALRAYFTGGPLLAINHHSEGSTCLNVCEVNLGAIWSQDDPCVNLWIRHALLCQTRALQVHLSIDNNSYELEDVALVSQRLMSHLSIGWNRKGANRKSILRILSSPKLATVAAQGGKGDGAASTVIVPWMGLRKDRIGDSRRKRRRGDNNLFRGQNSGEFDTGVRHAEIRKVGWFSGPPRSHP